MNKMVNEILLCLLFVIPVNRSYGQLKYSVVGFYKGRTAQAMAIWKDSAFLMTDGGICRVLNLKSKNIVREFMLASTKENPHVNNACFVTNKKDERMYPYLYITECRNQYRCFVEDLNGDVPTIVQEIRVQNEQKTERCLVWAVDYREKALYGITRYTRKQNSKEECVNCITKYRLPSIDEGFQVILSEKDVLDRFEVVFPNILQGCKIRGRYMYIVTGLQESCSDRKDSNRSIMVVDLNNKKLEKSVDLTYITTNEPEDMDFYKGKALLFCGQEGGIYQINKL